jgi:alkyl-hydroperoxide reductase/thiol specific antioxidant family protein
VGVDYRRLVGNWDSQCGFPSGHQYHVDSRGRDLSRELVHLQFRRFAGCPICNLHLRSFIRRHDELWVHGIHEVAVFHSPKSAMLEYQTSGAFPVIADPDKALYKAFGVETSILSVLNPRTWPAAIKGIFLAGPRLPSRGESSLGLPADFLIDTSGKIVALKYGRHASDHWEFDELLELANAAGKESQSRTTGYQRKTTKELL